MRIFAIVIVCAICVFVWCLNYFLIRKFNKDRSYIVRILWFGFSFALTSVFFAMFLAESTGALNAKGMPENDFGRVIVAVITFFADIESELKFISSLLFIVFMPQILAWILNAIHGRANGLLLFRREMKYLFWFVVKCFVSVSGIYVGFMASLPLYETNVDKTKFLILTILAATFFLFLSFSLTFAYYEWEKVPEIADKRLPGWLNKALCGLNQFATRNN